MVKQKWFKNEDAESADTPPPDQKIMKKKQRNNRNQSLHYKQTVHQNFSIISANKSWKSFIQTKKNEIKQIVYLIYQHKKTVKTLYNNLLKSL